MIKAILFDFDLTLVDTRPSVTAAFGDVCSMLEYKCTWKGFQDFVGTRFSRILNYLHDNYNIPKKTIIANYKRAYMKYIPKMKYYAKTLMPKLKNYKIGIVSNNTKQVLIPTCRHFKLKYDVLIADEDLKQGQTKPDAIIKAMKKLRVKKSEALYVGDHLNDIEAARKAGVKCVIIPKGVFTTTNIKRHNPDYVIPNINKLAEILK